MSQLNTIHFRKKFNVSGIPAKLQIAAELSQLLQKAQRLDGQPMGDEEYAALKELLTWCHDNTFYNKMPSDRFNQPAPDRARNQDRGQQAAGPP